MPLYSDCDTMLRDILGYVRSTGHAILSADDPLRGMLGFCTAQDPRVTWETPIENARAYPRQESARIFVNRDARIAFILRTQANAQDGIITSTEELAAIDARWGAAWNRAVDRARAGVQSSNSIGQLKISEVPIEPEAAARTYFDQLLEEVD